MSLCLVCRCITAAQSAFFSSRSVIPKKRPSEHPNQGIVHICPSPLPTAHAYPEHISPKAPVSPFPVSSASSHVICPVMGARRHVKPTAVWQTVQASHAKPVLARLPEYPSQLHHAPSNSLSVSIASFSVQPSLIQVLIYLIAPT